MKKIKKPEAWTAKPSLPRIVQTSSAMCGQIGHKIKVCVSINFQTRPLCMPSAPHSSRYLFNTAWNSKKPNLSASLNRSYFWFTFKSIWLFKIVSYWIYINFVVNYFIKIRWFSYFFYILFFKSRIRKCKNILQTSYTLKILSTLRRWK